MRADSEASSKFDPAAFFSWEDTSSGWSRRRACSPSDEEARLLSLTAAENLSRWAGSKCGAGREVWVVAAALLMEAARARPLALAVLLPVDWEGAMAAAAGVARVVMLGRTEAPPLAVRARATEGRGPDEPDSRRAVKGESEGPGGMGRE